MKSALLAFLVLVSTSFSTPAFRQEIIVYDVNRASLTVLSDNETVEKQMEEHLNMLESMKDTDEVVLVEDTEATTITEYCQIDNVNIRKGPSTDTEVIGSLWWNDSVEVIEYYDDEWDCIKFEDGIAFVYSEFLDEQPAPEPVKNYTERELYLLAHLLAGEVQGLPDQEQLYAGSVALNRVKHPLFPNSLEEVIFSPGQYACTWDGNFYREPTDRNWANAKWLLENGSVFPDNVVFQSGVPLGNGVYCQTQWNYFCIY